MPEIMLGARYTLMGESGHGFKNTGIGFDGCLNSKVTQHLTSPPHVFHLEKVI